MIELGKLRVGKVDGKHEYLVPLKDNDRRFFDAFLIPNTVDPDRLNNTDVFFVEGFRGTGKTSLLRWHSEKIRRSGVRTSTILFKSDLDETQKLHLSNEVGISWADIDPSKMEISQDFKSAWTWFIFHKIGELIKADNFDSDKRRTYLKLLGLLDQNAFQKAIGFMPKIEGSSISIKADIPFFEAELSGDFKKDGAKGRTTLEAINRRLSQIIREIEFPETIYIYFDELEVFHHSEEQYKRDQRMVRDLLFSISKLNDIFSEFGTPIHIIGAIRSEILDSMGSLGQEVDRLVHDRGFVISWHHAKKSIDHPLIQMVSRKIRASEEAAGGDISADPISAYFPNTIQGVTIDTFLLDRSFYKPRDIVWRLTIAQKLFPNESQFSEQVLHDTEIEYSNKMWDESRYELSATYSDSEIDVIEAVFAGGSMHFDLEYVQQRFERFSKHSEIAIKLLSRRGVADILNDLYRLGAIGNSFRVGTSGGDIRDRWAFRGDPMLLLDKRMTIHRALAKRLSVVPPRRRGSLGAGRSNRGDSENPV